MKTGTRSPRFIEIVLNPYRNILLVYHPTVPIIINIILNCAHSERVGIDSGDGGSVSTITRYYSESRLNIINIRNSAVN